uniref:Transmembrane protein n=1 Tax=Tetraselmis sp. GSL018 TaxID=582737 RepID=A0A061QVR7_9CHLO
MQQTTVISGDSLPVEWILFIVGFLCTPILCCIGACLPLCDRRFLQDRERSGWIANVIGSSLSFVIIIVVVVVIVVTTKKAVDAHNDFYDSLYDSDWRY